MHMHMHMCMCMLHVPVYPAARNMCAVATYPTRVREIVQLALCVKLVEETPWAPL